MQGLIKRNKWSVPFLPKYPKMTPEYQAEMDDLFFGRNISSLAKGDVVIALGSPIAIREEVEAIGHLKPNGAMALVLSGGVSPAYKKFAPEFAGAAIIEIFKGTFGFDIRKSEANRVGIRLAKKYDVFPDFIEDKSGNVYENLANSWQIVKDLNGARIVLTATIEQLPRAIETFKTVAGESITVKGLPYNPTVQGKWHKSPWWQSRFAAEVKKMNDYSDPNNDRIKNKIVLSAETAAKLRRIAEISR